MISAAELYHQALEIGFSPQGRKDKSCTLQARKDKSLKTGDDAANKYLQV